MENQDDNHLQVIWVVALMEKGITIPESKKKKAAEETSTEEDDEKMVAILMKDAKALGIIQNSVSDKIFPRIAMLIKLKWHGICYMKNIMSQEQRFELHNIDTAEKAFAPFSGNPKSQNKGVQSVF
ncbi:hypothetical protein L3X38_022863 [Prunus dulcis]|uniref:Uncharacterized protein n=1 Tax=Prunus dulcis TaxID=3755 RepID=A0AAD4VYF6_PRUDU|nr:hypothetical protein L3X38_022863 [Prunus dulcis]